MWGGHLVIILARMWEKANFSRCDGVRCWIDHCGGAPFCMCFVTRVSIGHGWPKKGPHRTSSTHHQLQKRPIPSSHRPRSLTTQASAITGPPPALWSYIHSVLRRKMKRSEQSKNSSNAFVVRRPHSCRLYPRRFFPSLGSGLFNNYHQMMLPRWMI